MAAGDNLVNRVQAALGTSQEGLGKLLGYSRRTIVRWAARGGRVDGFNAGRIARLVFPHDRALAAEAAESAGQTLESLGLVPTEAELRAKLDPPRAIDTIVGAAADALDCSPRRARRALRAALRTARRMGVSLEDMEKALAPPPAAPPAK